MNQMVKISCTGKVFDDIHEVMNINQTWESSPMSYIHLDTGGLVSAKAVVNNPLISYI
jgi:hypothetical protein